MSTGRSRRLIISVSSDIGLALAESWRARGIDVAGTYRTPTPAVRALQVAGVEAVRCDLDDPGSVDLACERLAGRPWDVLVVAAGTQEPIGPFTEIDIDAWERSIRTNLTSQLRAVHRLLPSRNREAPHGPLVLFFAGGGTNNATVNYSAYTLSKIGLIKMCELLDAEVPDTRFTILGPGWVKTKIHEATLAAPAPAGDNYTRTVEKLESDDLVPMDSVVACCDWIAGAARDVVGGRNISLVWDRWGDPALDAMLQGDPDMYRLRRAGNDRLPRAVPISLRERTNDPE